MTQEAGTALGRWWWGWRCRGRRQGAPPGSSLWRGQGPRQLRTVARHVYKEARGWGSATLSTPSSHVTLTPERILCPTKRHGSPDDVWDVSGLVLWVSLRALVTPLGARGGPGARPQETVPGENRRRDEAGGWGAPCQGGTGTASL